MQPRVSPGAQAVGAGVGRGPAHWHAQHHCPQSKKHTWRPTRAKLASKSGIARATISRTLPRAGPPSRPGSRTTSGRPTSKTGRRSRPSRSTWRKLRAAPTRKVTSRRLGGGGAASAAPRPRVNPLAALVGRIHQSHRLSLSGNILWCRRCGALAWQRVSALARECVGTVPASRRRSLLRLRGDRHPLDGGAIGRAIPVSIGLQGGMPTLVSAWTNAPGQEALWLPPRAEL